VSGSITIFAAGEAGYPTTFASNVLDIAFRRTNPADVASLAYLAKRG